MGKNEFLTPKAIANRIKAKGLQKLRWYCQMCQKQCRDENGFKCHCMSEGHQRQMEVFGQNPERIVDGFSEEFETTFMDHLKRTHRSRVAATVVYNEYIADRHHVHMNSTKWLTLTDFIKHLGKVGKCKVEETDKGWFVTYIDRDSEALFREREMKARKRAEVSGEERNQREIEEQIAKASEILGARSEGGREEKKVEIEREFGGRVTMEMKPKEEKARGVERKKGVFEDEDEEEEREKKKKKVERGGERGRKTRMEEIIEEEEREKMSEKYRTKNWLCEGIVVKVLSQVQERKFYKKKGVVKKVVDRVMAEVKMIECGTRLKVDMEELETVLPHLGGLVKIVNGAYRGSNARLITLNEKEFSAKVQIEKGVYNGRVLDAVSYDDICKLA